MTEAQPAMAQHGAPPAFEIEPELYEAMVDWPRRLEREGPFFRAVFDAVKVRRLLDLACGTGNHAAMFASWGLQVTGMDSSPSMIDHCRRRHGTTDRLRWQRGALETLHEVRQTFDAVTCIGNSLSLLGDAAAVESVIRGIGRIVEKGGVCIVQVLNLHRLADGPIVWQKACRVSVGDADHVVVKGVHRSGPQGFVDVAALELAGSHVNSRCSSTPLLALEAGAMRRGFESAGFPFVECFGSYERSPFVTGASTDLIVSARKAGPNCTGVSATGWNSPSEAPIRT